MNNRIDNYVYVYLDRRKPGKWFYKGLIFDFEPFYVGRGINRRIYGHLRPRDRNDGTLKSNIINKIFNKFNLPPLIHKIYENLTFEESEQIEIDFIATFGRRDLGLGPLANLTDGGAGTKRRVKDKTKKVLKSRRGEIQRAKPLEQWSLDGTLIKIWYSVRVLLDTWNLGRSEGSSIYKCCSNGKPYKGFIWKYGEPNLSGRPSTENKTKKPVYQYSIDGDFIKKFDSMSEARYQIGVLGIDQCCYGLRPTSGGYRWAYDYRGEHFEFPPLGAKSRLVTKLVDSYDLNGEFLQTFNSVEDAAKAMGCVKRALLNAISKGFSSQSRYWKYRSGSPGKHFGVSNRNNREVYQYYKGNFVLKHETIEAAAKFAGLSYAKIRISCLRGISREGYEWFFEYKGETVERPTERINQSEKRVNVFDISGNFVESYKSIRETSKIMNIKDLRYALKTGKKINGFIFKIEEPDIPL